jgi:glycosyltransferase involved in cell wall biosynthesis
MKILSNKNILIISPESWGKSYLSKHFYALELLKNGNRIWFLNSPYYKKDEFARKTEAENLGLTIVDDEVFAGLLQLPTVLQRIIVRRQIKRLQKKCNVTWDIIWSFDNARYFFLDCFDNASFRIHHVMDEHMNYELKACCHSADLCLGVTPEIANECSRYDSHSSFLQHGFAEFKMQPVHLDKGSETIHLAYIGNLLLPSFDHALLLELAQNFKQIRFHLIGSFSSGNLNASVSANHPFIDQLSAQNNVVLYGERSYDEALTLASQADILALMYFDSNQKVAGNSSKILPYLFTGKVIVSNYFSFYEGKNLLEMVKSRDKYSSLLQSTLDSLDELNGMDKREARVKYAQTNSYTNHLLQVDELLANLHP